MALALSWELFVPGRTLYRWDTLLYNWPLVLETRSQWLSGHVPFWASSFCCGTPLLENINAGVLYPLRLLCWLLPLIPGYHLFLFAHVWLSLVGMHVLLRRGMRLPAIAAFAGALAYAASGYARSMWDTHNFMALPWIPLGLAALLEVRRPAGRPLAVLATAWCWTMMLLGGDFQAACLWVPAALLLAVLRRDRVVLLRSLVAALLLAALVTAPQWLPSYFAAGQSYRAGGLPHLEAVERSFNPIRLVELLMPHAFGNRDAWLGHALAGPEATRTLPWTTSFHVGVFTLLLAALGLRRRRNPCVAWAIALSVVPLFLSFGRFLPGFRLWRSLPLLGQFRYPEKYLLWSTLALAVLAAHGTRAAVALWRRGRSATLCLRALGPWTLAVAVNGLVATALGWAVATGREGFCAWTAARGVCLAILVAAVWAVALRGPRSRTAAARLLAALLGLDAALWWYAEMPTAAGFDPLSPPAVARLVRNSGHPWGRVLHDPAAAPPLPPAYAEKPTSQKAAIRFRESLAVDSPRLWGLYSADGFSPMEAEAMRALRSRLLEPAGKAAPDADALAEFCRLTGVEWLLTTGDRARGLVQHGLDLEVVQRWAGQTGLPRLDTVLARVKGVQPAECFPHAPTGGPEMYHVWRARPGRIRIDLRPGGSADLVVKETFSPGWRATDAHGRALPVYPASQAFIGVKVPAHVSQVRLTYVPVGWRAGLWMGVAGLLVAVSLLTAGFGEDRLRAALRSPAFCATVAALVFLCVGVAARNHWSCTFDEGFHVARGLTLLQTGDSRLNYFHPPMQNLLCAYFSALAHSERTYMPVGNAAWEQADIGRYAVDFAWANRSIFLDLVQASRWGSALLGAALCALLAFWAARAAGPLGGWLAAAGAALNPNLLAHGHLTTTDMGITFFALCGTYALWRQLGSTSGRHLLWATLAFVLAALTKHSGLIWFGAFLACLPMLAARSRSPKLLFYVPFALALFAALLLLLYGTSPQAIRAGPSDAWNGTLVPAGRYLEGLLDQSRHALRGHRAFFAGRQFTRCAWWHTVAMLGLKSPPVWLLVGLVSIAFSVRRPTSMWLPWLPAVTFSVLFLFANRMAIGVRHALPLQALLVLAGAVGCARLPHALARRAVGLALAVSSLFASALAFPDFIAYFPAWAGGTSGGYRWLADSNYDWGQDLGVLEEHWAALAEATGGRRPRLIYYGFANPEVVCDLPLRQPSLAGYMGYEWKRQEASEQYAQWRAGLLSDSGPVLASVSALRLGPYGLDFEILQQTPLIGRLGRCLLLLGGPKQPDIQATRPPQETR